MWLRLTAFSDGTPMLANMNEITSIITEDDGVVWLIPSSSDVDSCPIKESIDEIEIMLAGKGAEVKRADPHARSFIGSKPEPWPADNLKSGIEG